MSLYPSLEDMQVDQMVQVSTYSSIQNPDEELKVKRRNLICVIFFVKLFISSLNTKETTSIWRIFIFSHFFRKHQNWNA